MNDRDPYNRNLRLKHSKLYNLTEKNEGQSVVQNDLRTSHIVVASFMGVMPNYQERILNLVPSSWIDYGLFEFGKRFLSRIDQGIGTLSLATAILSKEWEMSN